MNPAQVVVIIFGAVSYFVLSAAALREARDGGRPAVIGVWVGVTLLGAGLVMRLWALRILGSLLLVLIWVLTRNRGNDG